MVRNTNKNMAIQKKEVLRYCYVTFIPIRINFIQNLF